MPNPMLSNPSNSHLRHWTFILGIPDCNLSSLMIFLYIFIYLIEHPPKGINYICFLKCNRVRTKEKESNRFLEILLMYHKSFVF